MLNLLSARYVFWTTRFLKKTIFSAFSYLLGFYRSITLLLMEQMLFQFSKYEFFIKIREPNSLWSIPKSAQFLCKHLEYQQSSNIVVHMRQCLPKRRTRRRRFPWCPLPDCRRCPHRCPLSVDHRRILGTRSESWDTYSSNRQDSFPWPCWWSTFDCF